MEILKSTILNTRPSLSADELQKYESLRATMNGEQAKKPKDKPRRIGFV